MAEFRLHEDGSVSDIRIVESTVRRVPEFLCRRAIRESAPFLKWSPVTKADLDGGDSMLIKFTFNYD